MEISIRAIYDFNIREESQSPFQRITGDETGEMGTPNPANNISIDI
jgi:hypothetical protein